MVSIIIRTRNEERWISSCLGAVFNQDYKDIEVVIVDDHSTDKTIEKAKQFDVKVVYIEDFSPGKALNEGILKSKGEYICCISAHCIPVNDQWLSKLIQNLKDKDIAGVYGRQEPMPFSSDFDKRDLFITFGLDKRIQMKDSFFHNANSMIRRDVWEKIPFNENVSNIEDRVWAEDVIKAGYKLIYEPEASVYHYHGIHQSADPQRCRKVVGILEGLNNQKGEKTDTSEIIKNMNIVAIIPVRGECLYLKGKSLLEYTIQSARESNYIKKIIVSSDNQKMAELAKSLGAEASFLRTPDLSKEYVDLGKVFQFTIEKIEALDILPDLIVTLELTFPFRPFGFIDDIIRELLEGGFDSVIAAKAEFKSCWMEDGGGIRRIDEGFIPRKFKHPIYIGIKGLGCVTYPASLREGELLGSKVGIVKVEDPFSSVEVRDEQDFKIAERLVDEWLAERRNSEIRYRE